MKVVIIGNGFDLRHKLPTRFSDFFRAFKNHYGKLNVILNYCEAINNSNGWLDFEQDLLLFFEHLSKFRNTMSFLAKKSIYRINKTDFITSPETMIFYDAIQSMEYEYFSKDSENGSIVIRDQRWTSLIIKDVLDDFNELKSYLKEYLTEVESKYVSNQNKTMLNTREIKILMEADKVYSFNYTDLLSQYGIKNVKFAHGSLKDEIILGIPFSTKIDIKELHKLFKISQSIDLSLNTKIYDNLRDKLELYFVGFSFGASDHYFFQEVKDWISKYTLNDYTKMPPIYFNFFCHSSDAKLDYLYNLRIFLGEEMLTRFDTARNIKFIMYDKIS